MQTDGPEADLKQAPNLLKTILQTMTAVLTDATDPSGLDNTTGWGNKLMDTDRGCPQ